MFFGTSFCTESGRCRVEKVCEAKRKFVLPGDTKGPASLYASRLFPESGKMFFLVLKNILILFFFFLSSITHC